MTEVFKGLLGWEARTDITLDRDYVLRLRTARQSNGIVFTTATRYGDCIRTAIGHVDIAAYSKIVVREPISRITEKAIRTQHQYVLDRVQSVTAQVNSALALLELCQSILSFISAKSQWWNEQLQTGGDALKRWHFHAERTRMVDDARRTLAGFVALVDGGELDWLGAAGQEPFKEKALQMARAGAAFSFDFHLDVQQDQLAA